MQKIFKRLGALCFMVMWIPFIMIMVKLPSIGENPEMVYGAPKEISIWLILTVSLALGGFLFMILSIIAGVFAIRHILRNGQTVKAKILSVKDSGTRINRNPVLEFTLEVQTPDQGTINTEGQKLVSIVDVATYQPGVEIEVKYLPGTKKVAVI